MLNLWLDPDDVIQVEESNANVDNVLPRPKRTVSDHFRATSKTTEGPEAPEAAEAPKDAEVPGAVADVIEISDNDADGVGDDDVVPHADMVDALVPVVSDVNSDAERDDGDDEDWPRYMNACFDGSDCRYREVQQVNSSKFNIAMDFGDNEFIVNRACRLYLIYLWFFYESTTWQLQIICIGKKRLIPLVIYRIKLIHVVS